MNNTEILAEFNTSRINSDREMERLKLENSALQKAFEESVKEKVELTQEKAELAAQNVQQEEEIDATRTNILKRVGKTSGTYKNAPFSVFKIRHDSEEKFILNTVYDNTNYHFQISRKMAETLAENKLIEMPYKTSQFAFNKKSLRFYVCDKIIVIDAVDAKRTIQAIPIEYFDLTSLEMMSHH